MNHPQSHPKHYRCHPMQGMAHLGKVTADQEEEAIILLAPKFGHTKQHVERLIAFIGLNLGSPQQARRVVVRLDGDEYPVVEVGAGEVIGPVATTSGWNEVARERGRVLLVVDSSPFPAGIGFGDYIEEHVERAAKGWVAVVGERLVS